MEDLGEHNQKTLQISKFTLFLHQKTLFRTEEQVELSFPLTLVSKKYVDKNSERKPKFRFADTHMSDSPDVSTEIPTRQISDCVTSVYLSMYHVTVENLTIFSESKSDHEIIQAMVCFAIFYEYLLLLQSVSFMVITIMVIFIGTVGRGGHITLKHLVKKNVIAVCQTDCNLYWIL